MYYLKTLARGKMKDVGTARTMKVALRKAATLARKLNTPVDVGRESDGAIYLLRVVHPDGHVSKV